MRFREWVSWEWRGWVATHPWTMLYVVGVTTANFLINLAETFA